MPDLYQTLGVARSATKDEIKKAYRKLAKEHHPDRNPGDKKAEERFKQIAFAHDVLTDDKRRVAYDKFGDVALKEGFNAEAYDQYRNQYSRGRGGFGGATPGDFQGGQWEVNLEDLFGGGLGDIFGRSARGRRSRARAAHDVGVDVKISFEESVQGAEKALSFHEPGLGGRVKQWVGASKGLKFRIPPGVRDGEKVRLKGQGPAVTGDEDAGDLIVTVHIHPHPLYRREGNDIHMPLPLTLDEAWFGASVDVPTVNGIVKLKIGPKTSSGAKLRLKGKGIRRSGTPQGDLIVHTQIKLPDVDSEEVAQWAQRAKQFYAGFVRFPLK